MLNKCIFIGNLGKDSEIKYMPSGDGVASFSIACTERYKDKAGEKKEITEWINCTLFGKRAEALNQYLLKGQRVYVEGKFKTRKWQGTDGKDNYSTFIKVDDLKLMGSGKNAATAPTTSTNNNTPPEPPEPPEFDDFDDDIPF